MSVRTQPCEACPYRKDVASGVWAAEEYLKLPPYDAPTGEQPPVPFLCHATTDFYCHGWAVTGMSRGHAYELLAIRLLEMFGRCAIAIPEPKVPLFESGLAAAEHGLKDINRPKKKARKTQARLVKRYARLSVTDASSDLAGEEPTSVG